MRRPPQDMKTAPVHVAKQNTEAAAPATTNAQGHRNSMSHSTAVVAPSGSAVGHDLPTAADIIREAMGHRLRAEELLLAADPVAVELHELGFRMGLKEGERCAGERAARNAARFLAYVAEEPQATPGRIPPLDDYRGAPA